ncbi:MAG: hypothetical protein ACHQ53_02860 [Polyangiales bacterium]
MARGFAPKNYGSFADFEREELRPMNRVGFTVADLEVEAGFKSFDDQVEIDAEELDFG